MISRLSKGRIVLLLGLLACIAFLPVALFAQGKGNGVEVRAVSATLVETEPGRIVSTSFLVTSKTDQEEGFIESLSLPADWQAIGPMISITIPPQEKQVRIVAFLTPANTSAGSYEITYSVRSQRDYGIQDSETIEVRVLQVSKLASCWRTSRIQSLLATSMRLIRGSSTRAIPRCDWRSARRACSITALPWSPPRSPCRPEAPRL